MTGGRKPKATPARASVVPGGGPAGGAAGAARVRSVPAPPPALQGGAGAWPGAWLRKCRHAAVPSILPPARTCRNSSSGLATPV